MASDLQRETRKMALTTTMKVEDFVTGCSGLYLVADGDCVVDFDQPSDVGSFLVKANILYELEKIQFTKLYAITLSSTANLYILAFR